MKNPLKSKNNQGTPSLSEVIKTAIKNQLLQVHVGMPGSVVAYHEEDGTADVQPLLKRLYSDGISQPLPMIQHAPIEYLGPANGWFHFPLNPGDTGMIQFSERSIDQWFAGVGDGGPVDPADDRIFDISDAIFVPGIRTAANAIVPKGASTSMEMAFGNSWIEITADGRFKITNGSVEVLNVIDALIQALLTATVPFSPGPLDPGTIATLTNLKTEIDSVKG